MAHPTNARVICRHSQASTTARQDAEGRCGGEAGRQSHRETQRQRDRQAGRQTGGCCHRHTTAGIVTVCRFASTVHHPPTLHTPLCWLFPLCRACMPCLTWPSMKASSTEKMARQYTPTSRSMAPPHLMPESPASATSSAATTHYSQRHRQQQQQRQHDQPPAAV